MTIALIVKLVHILLGIGLVVGIVGRDVTLRRAAWADDLGTVHALLDVADVFERILVRPMSMLVVAVGLVSALLQGVPILGFLVGGTTNWLLASVVLFVAIVLLVPTVFLPRGRIFAAALAASDGQGVVTPELQAAFHDPAVERGRLAELIGLIVVIALMVLKPF